MSGVKRAQKSATRSTACASASGSASQTTSAGWRARASASVRPAVKAEPRGLRVDAGEPARVLDRRDGRQRRARINAMRAPRAVGRQPRQPQGEKASARQKLAPRYARSGGRFASDRGPAPPRPR